MPTSAARSGNPAKRAAAKPVSVSSASSFKKKLVAQPVTLPSGEVARIRRIELTTLLAEGLLGDEISVIAQKAIDSGKGVSPAQQKEMTEDPSKVGAMLDAFDRIVCRTWVEPTVIYYRAVWNEDAGTWVMPDPNTQTPVVPETERDEEQLFSDELSMDDKIFTFNYISGGSPDLAEFRKQFGESLAHLSDGQGVVMPAE
jgi:hypothetical protein